MAPEKATEMAKWVGELSTESSRVRIGVEARRFIDYSINNVREKEEALEISSKETKRKKKKKSD